MAITIDSHESANISNEADYSVSTSLTEGASYQNLRIRATLYIGGESEAVAILEQPKGLDDWDFADILKTFTGKCDFPVGDTELLVVPGVGSQLISSWANYYSTYSTFTSSANNVTNAVAGGAAVANSNDIGSFETGDIYVIGVQNDFQDLGSGDFRLGLATAAGNTDVCATNRAGFTFGSELDNNQVYFLMGHGSASTPVIHLRTTAATNGSGTFRCHKIDDFRNNPAIYYHIEFEEVYENASDVTTTGASTWSDCMLFYPAILRPDENIFDFDGSGSQVLSRIGEGGQIFKYGQGMEIRLFYVDGAVFPDVTMTTDAGPQNQFETGCGWGMIILNDNLTGLDAQDESVEIVLESQQIDTTTIYSKATVTVPCETRCFPNLKVLNFVGFLGEESVMFRGLPSETGRVDKTFYSDVRRIRKVLKSFRSTRMKLRTLVENEATRRTLHELIWAEADVWMYDEDFDDGYRVVTVLDKDTVILSKNDLIENDIDVEYYE